MGQYWKPVNLDKKEYLHAHKFDEGLKLLEQAYSSGGVTTALCLLLARGLNDGPRGGGDPRSGGSMLGRWAGDRIVFVGDYCDPELYKALDEEYTDISELALEMVKQNP